MLFFRQIHFLLFSNVASVTLHSLSRNCLLKKNLLIKRDRPVLNKNISSAKLFLFDNK